MGVIVDLADEVYRDYVTDGVPASGAWAPEKSEIRDLFELIEEQLSAPSQNIGLGVAADANVFLSVQTSANKRGIKIDHYASETGQYALDIHCFKNAGTDANSAIAIHNYSSDFPAMLIDSTDDQTLLALNNSENALTSPGTKGTGPFIAFSGYGGDEPDTRRNLGFINGQIQFAHNFDDVMWTFATGLAVNGGPSLTNRALAVTALNSGYATTISGVDSGLFVSTSDDGGNTLVAQKNDTGAGTVAWFINGGVGDSILVTDDVAAVLFKVDSLGQIIAPGLPTADPEVVDMLWNDAGAVKVSAGP